MTISPCAYPRCDDGTGNPVLTTLGICEYCRDHFHQVLGWLYDDYRTLKTTFPKPARVSMVSGSGASQAVAGFGHPAEWASVNAQEIAAWATTVLNNMVDDLTPELPHLNMAVDEAARVAVAFYYFAQHFDQLCTWAQAGAIATEAGTMHNTIRRGLGKTRLIQRLAAPCPTCHAITLTQSPGYDTVTCESCGYRMGADRYGAAQALALTDAAGEARNTAADLLAAFDRKQLHTKIRDLLSHATMGQ